MLECLSNLLDMVRVLLRIYRQLCTVYSFEENALIITTIPGNITARHLPVKLELKDGSQIDTKYTFEYRPNPVFTDIRPTNHLTV